MYIALTSASEHLILLHNCKYEYLNFIKKEKLKKTVDIIKINNIYPKKEN